MPKILNCVLDFFFPPVCLHCEAEGYPLCRTCIELLDIQPVSSNLIVTFEGRGPARSLVQAFKSGRHPHLAKALAGYMAIQYLQSSYPIPDLIVPVPQSFIRELEVGYNPAMELAVQIGKVLKRPVVQLLKRKGRWPRQSKLSTQDRYHLPRETFQWKKMIDIRGKTILVVDDMMGTKTTLRRCIDRLKERVPADIFGIAAVNEELSCDGNAFINGEAGSGDIPSDLGIAAEHDA